LQCLKSKNAAGSFPLSRQNSLGNLPSREWWVATLQ